MSTTRSDIERPAGSGTEARGRPARRPWRAGRTAVITARVVLLIVLLSAWEALSGPVVDPFFVSSPSAVAVEWWDWVISGQLWFHASSTFYSTIVGFAVGGSVAIVLGYLLGGSPWAAAVLEPFITGIYSLPKLALVPLFVLWFGIGRELQVMIAAIVTFFLMFYNTYYGVREVDRSLVDAVRIMGGRRRDLAFRVRLPSALVWVVAGLKLSVPQALVAVVVAEILASNRGLGHLVANNAGQFNTAGTFAALATLLVIGLALDRLAGLATRRALVWKEGAGR
ncbi:hypothetical protein AD006_28440 (plasmid) [Pseudonocardia sp. EC080610-09]|uniref:ABC transporter permease n=1 Tax=unclassified Pseudonocardia TaxID=2619320 RepID=UPI0007057DF3|nr:MULTISPECIES: ABC transporter permease [unclassified Pseudonocardia]ALL79261.1 hypothetical protein AD006_28440 [Pseudonocardia sp. EC080610-09]ALL85231.1 hypothetical protein AD017_28830 [Pseudonocardia sp. EC080619-01]